MKRAGLTAWLAPLMVIALGAVGSVAHAGSLIGDDVDVSVPRSELTKAQGVEQNSVDTTFSLFATHYGQGPQLELSASTWVPGSLTVGSGLKGVSAMEGMGVPTTSLTLLSSPVTRWHSLTVNLLAGIGFGVFNRNGTYPGDDATPARPIEENFYLIPVRVGVEAQLGIVGPWSAYGGFAVVPMMGFTTRTIFDDGQTTFGLPLEVSMGVSNDLRWLSSSLRGILLKAGVDATASPFATADFSGVGAQAGVSFPL